jgi:hypothetical protein
MRRILACNRCIDQDHMPNSEMINQVISIQSFLSRLVNAYCSRVELDHSLHLLK